MIVQTKSPAAQASADGAISKTMLKKPTPVKWEFQWQR